MRPSSDELLYAPFLLRGGTESIESRLVVVTLVPIQEVVESFKLAMESMATSVLGVLHGQEEERIGMGRCGLVGDAGPMLVDLSDDFLTVSRCL